MTWKSRDSPLTPILCLHAMQFFASHPWKCINQLPYGQLPLLADFFREKRLNGRKGDVFICENTTGKWQGWQRSRGNVEGAGCKETSSHEREQRTINCPASKDRFAEGIEHGSHSPILRLQLRHSCIGNRGLFVTSGEREISTRMYGSCNYAE